VVDIQIVLWLYQRDTDTLRLRTAYDNATKAFVATITASDGEEQCLRFDNAEAFRAWLLALETRLEQEHWTADGPPMLLPSGWPDKRLG
jgi:hypothetical protein